MTFIRTSDVSFDKFSKEHELIVRSGKISFSFRNTKFLNLRFAWKRFCFFRTTSSMSPIPKDMFPN